MSDNDKKFLTEVDKMIMKLDEIIIAIKGEEGVINYKNVKDMTKDEMIAELIKKDFEIERLKKKYPWLASTEDTDIDGQNK